MPPLYEQRSEMIQLNTDLILDWLTLLDESGQRNLISSMIRKYSLSELRKMHSHITEQVIIAKTKVTK